MEILIGGFVAVAFFALGVAFHKYAISETKSIKEHISSEVGNIRQRIRALEEAIAQKLR